MSDVFPFFSKVIDFKSSLNLPVTNIITYYAFCVPEKNQVQGYTFLRKQKLINLHTRFHKRLQKILCIIKQFWIVMHML